MSQSREVEVIGGGSMIAAQTAGQMQAVSREIETVRGAMIMAREFPRHEGRALQAIEAICGNERFAEIAAYEYPRGGETIWGLSIRAAEALAQAWGNIDASVKIVESFNGDAGQAGWSRVSISCWDMQTNSRKALEIIVPHERVTKKGTTVLHDPRDIYEAVMNQAQRRLRACILAVIPKHIQMAAEDAIEKATSKKYQGDMAGYRAKAVEMMGKLGVTVDHLEKKFGKKVAALTDKDLGQIKRIYNSVNDGMSKLGDHFEMPADAAEVRADAAKQSAPISVQDQKTLDDARLAFDMAAESADAASLDIAKILGVKLEDIKSWNDPKRFDTAAGLLKKAVAEVAK